MYTDVKLYHAPETYMLLGSTTSIREKQKSKSKTIPPSWKLANKERIHACEDDQHHRRALINLTEERSYN